MAIQSANKNNNGGVYIHIPFCARKCKYCDFFSVTNQAEIDRYLQNLSAEISAWRGNNPDYEATTIYVGGGTPSVLSREQLRSLDTIFKRNFDMNFVREYTFESNPVSLTQEKAELLLRCGVDRLSIGVQSFFNDDLEFLGRIHTGSEALQAIDIAKSFDLKVNCDLIYSIPGQSREHLFRNLDILFDKKIDHISAYTLIYEPGTPMYQKMQNGEIRPNSDDVEANLYLEVSEYLDSHDYSHYEISNYAARTRGAKASESLHNMNYWTRGNYIGFGAGAHSLFRGRRWCNPPDIKEYYNIISGGAKNPETEELTKQNEADETLMLGLRTNRGIDFEQIFLDYGVNFACDHQATISHLITYGYAYRNGKRFVLTPLGFTICDEIVRQFLV